MTPEELSGRVVSAADDALGTGVVSHCPLPHDVTIKTVVTAWEATRTSPAARSGPKPGEGIVATCTDRGRHPRQELSSPLAPVRHPDGSSDVLVYGHAKGTQYQWSGAPGGDRFTFRCPVCPRNLPRKAARFCDELSALLNAGIRDYDISFMQR